MYFALSLSPVLTQLRSVEPAVITLTPLPLTGVPTGSPVFHRGIRQGSFFTMIDYNEFVKSKRHTLGEFGFEPDYFPDIAFDFQKAIIEKAVKKGRIAIFADTGLGQNINAAFNRSQCGEKN